MKSSFNDMEEDLRKLQKRMYLNPAFTYDQTMDIHKLVCRIENIIEEARGPIKVVF